jgi:arsenate reductase-like glutaredoxin family protein
MKNLLVVLVVVGLGYFGYQKFIAEGETKLDALYEMPYIIVYGKTTCGWTQKCLRELKEQNIDVIFENIDKQEIQKEIFPRIDAAGHKRNRISIPIIDVNGHILIGYEPEKILTLYQQY